jgi:glycosyltransferase involved in cell wall biosynthesis
MWFLNRGLRILTVGSVPPEWGGQTDGGVAVVHKQLLSSLFQNPKRAKVVGTIATNASSSCLVASGTKKLYCPPADTLNEKAWYLRLLRSLKPDCVVFFHVSNRWAQYHLESSIPMMGAIHSWNNITQANPEKSAKVTQFLPEVLSRCNAVLFPSDYTRVEGLALGFSYSCPVQIAHNPLVEAFRTDVSEGKSRGAANTFMAIGALKPVKRFDFVLRAAQTHDLNGCMVGAGDEEQNLKSLAKNLGVAGRVDFCGHLKQKEIARLCHKASVYLGPSLSESFGNVYIEALACGLPVVGFKETLQEIERSLGVAVGIGVSGDATFEQFQASLETVLRQSWDRSVLSRRVRDVFSPERTMKNYLKAIEKAIA